MKDTDLQHDFVDRVVAYYSSGLNNVPGANHYEVRVGIAYSFRARPDIGGHLAFVRVAAPRSAPLTWAYISCPCSASLRRACAHDD